MLVGVLVRVDGKRNSIKRSRVRVDGAFHMSHVPVHAQSTSQRLFSNDGVFIYTLVLKKHERPGNTSVHFAKEKRVHL